MVVTCFIIPMSVTMPQLLGSVPSGIRIRPSVCVQASGRLAAPSWTATSGAATKEAEIHLLATSLMSQESRAPRHAFKESLHSCGDKKFLHRGRVCSSRLTPHACCTEGERRIYKSKTLDGLTHEMTIQLNRSFQSYIREDMTYNTRGQKAYIEGLALCTLQKG